MTVVADTPATAAPHLPPHAQPAEDVVQGLATDPERGLTDAEAASRLVTYGPNSLPEPSGRSFLRALMDQFANFLIVLLIIATAVAAAIGEYVDAVTVAAVPLKVTAFWLGVVLKPVPKMVTGVPTGPRFGLNSIMDTCS